MGLEKIKLSKVILKSHIKYFNSQDLPFWISGFCNIQENEIGMKVDNRFYSFYQKNNSCVFSSLEFYVRIMASFDISWIEISYMIIKLYI